MVDFLLLATIFLLAGVIAVPIAARLGLGSVLGYLIAGVAISPLLTTLNVDVIAIQHFAEFGVVMMLFLVGLELEPKKLWDMRLRLGGLGGLQVGLTTALIAAAALALGQPPAIALTIGLVLALSSTAIVLQTYNEKGLMGSDAGRSGFSVLLFQDIAVIPMLALIPLLAMPEIIDATTAVVDGGHAGDGHGADSHAEGHDDHHGDDHGSSFSLVAGLAPWQTALVTLGAVGAVVLIGARLTRPIFQLIAWAKLRELFTAGALLIVIGIALLMLLVDLSPALGAFLAGVVLAGSEYRHELESDIDPFRGLLLGLFFMTVGASVDFALLASSWQAVISLTLGLMAIKAGVLLALTFLFKVEGSDRWLFALSLAQAGEFGFVLISFTVANNVLPDAVADPLLLVVALSMLLTPLLFILHDRVIAPRFAGAEGREADAIDHPEEVIIAGHGRFGGIVNRVMRGAGYATTVVDYSSEQLEILRKFGLPVHFGDATRPDLLKAAGIERAKLFIVAIDQKDDITRVVRYVVEHYPNVHVLARAVDRHHVYELYAAGCRDIIRESYDSSIRAGRCALEAMGHERAEADRMAAAFEEMDRAIMVEVAELYDPDVPAHENQPYLEKVNAMRDAWEAELQGKMKGD